MPFQPLVRCFVWEACIADSRATLIRSRTSRHLWETTSPKSHDRDPHLDGHLTRNPLYPCSGHLQFQIFQPGSQSMEPSHQDPLDSVHSLCSSCSWQVRHLLPLPSSQVITSTALALTHFFLVNVTPEFWTAWFAFYGIFCLGTFIMSLRFALVFSLPPIWCELSLL